MIPLAERVPYYRFGLKEERQLLQLLALNDLGNGANGHDLLQYLRENDYLRGRELFLFPAPTLLRTTRVRSQPQLYI